MMTMTTLTTMTTATRTAEVLRRAYPRVLARTFAFVRSLHEAEDAVQEAVARALTTWDERGMPEAPEAWLSTVAANVHRAPMYAGRIRGVGPRYCPSVEDKVMRFSDRERHQVFLEPESLSTDVVYVNGISTSLPADVQEAFVRTVPGLERARFLRHGYAVAGLVDAHAHLTGSDVDAMVEGMSDRLDAVVRSHAGAQIDAGVLMIADKGSRTDSMLDLSGIDHTERPIVHHAGPMVTTPGRPTPATPTACASTRRPWRSASRPTPPSPCRT